MVESWRTGVLKPAIESCAENFTVRWRYLPLERGKKLVGFGRIYSDSVKSRGCPSGVAGSDR